MTSLSMPTAEPKHARADIRHVRQFEQTLNGSVFAIGAVKNRKDHIDGSSAEVRQ